MEAFASVHEYNQAIKVNRRRFDNKTNNKYLYHVYRWMIIKLLSKQSRRPKFIALWFFISVNISAVGACAHQILNIFPKRISLCLSSCFTSAEFCSIAVIYTRTKCHCYRTSVKNRLLSRCVAVPHFNDQLIFLLKFSINPKLIDEIAATDEQFWSTKKSALSGKCSQVPSRRTDVIGLVNFFLPRMSSHQ